MAFATPNYLIQEVVREDVAYDYRTSYEKLLLLKDWESCLKEGISAARLKQQARRMSDTECALRMQQRKRKLLDACRSRR